MRTSVSFLCTERANLSELDGRKTRKKNLHVVHSGMSAGSVVQWIAHWTSRPPDKAIWHRDFWHSAKLAWPTNTEAVPQSLKKHPMEFEVHIKLLSIHEDVGTDGCSAREPKIAEIFNEIKFQI